MTDFRSTAYDPRFDTGGASARGESMAGPILVYVGLLLTVFTGGLSFIAAMILAYVMKGEAGPVAWGHYVYALRTAWGWLAATALGVVACLVCVPLMLVLIGFPLIVAAGLFLVAAKAWLIVRCIIGVAKSAEGRALRDPRAFWL